MIASALRWILYGAAAVGVIVGCFIAFIVIQCVRYPHVAAHVNMVAVPR